MRLSRSRRLSIAGGAAALAGVTTWLVMYAGLPGSQSDTPGTPTPPAISQAPLQPTDLGKVKQQLGPFMILPVQGDTPTPDTHSPAVLLLSDGSKAEASTKWTVPFNTTQWSRQELPNLEGKSLAQNYATLKFNVTNLFMVKCNQPFVLEPMADRLFVVDSRGQSWSIIMTRAFALRRPLQ